MPASRHISSHERLRILACHAPPGPKPRLLRLCLWSLLLFLSLPGVCGAAERPEPVASFFEPDFPFVQSAVELSCPNVSGTTSRQVVVRGIVLKVGQTLWVLFDQELLRVAAFWRSAKANAPLQLASMSQVSYAEPHRKAGNALPKPASPPLLVTPAAPGMAASAVQLLKDPRPMAGVAEFGRGPLPLEMGRFEGIALENGSPCLHYQICGVPVRERLKTASGFLVRELEIGPHAVPLHIGLSGVAMHPWILSANSTRAVSGDLEISCSADLAALHPDPTALRAVVAPSASTETVVFCYGSSSGRDVALPKVASAARKAPASRRWKESVVSRAKMATEQVHGLACDSIGLPVLNPWKRRIRPADLAFVSEDRAAVVTYDGDVWMVDGFGRPDLSEFTWHRFASGLNEPLTIAARNGRVQVYTRNGLVLLSDRDGDGEADWYGNFSDAWVQSSSNRAFPLDMALAPDGATYISQGGIGRGSPHAGSITRISADGSRAEIISTGAREPYLALHPETGLLTSTDQQGNFVPSSVCYLVRPGAGFGFGEERPKKLTPPLVWIPHHEDNSCASEIWLCGRPFGALTGKLLHLSYGRGTPLLVCPDLSGPIPQGAVIPLGLQTRLPLLHAKLHPKHAAVFTCGFQIYDSRAESNWGLARIRLSGEAVTAPIDARSTRDGVLISFATELDPSSVNQDGIIASSWNYRRSKDYGSGRYTRAGSSGVDPVPIGQVLLSLDRKTVFVHLPDLSPVMQLGISHQFRFQNGAEARGDVYFTIHKPQPLDLKASGFSGADLSRSVPVVRMPKTEPATRERGKDLSVQMGCVACHSTDGSTQGKTGPTWKGLFGRDRFFADGSMESANEYYLRASILEPEKKVVAGYHAGMASYKGVLTEDQIDSIILYIRSLR